MLMDADGRVGLKAHAALQPLIAAQPLRALLLCSVTCITNARHNAQSPILNERFYLM
jgi:hypothetical protein